MSSLHLPGYKELDKKRWVVRYLIIVAVIAVLLIKTNMILFELDRLLGIYSFLTTFILSNILILAWFKYKDPFIKARNIDFTKVKPPFISIVVPVKNEEGNIRNCVMSCINQTYMHREVIVVDDCSNDKTGEILDEIQKEVGADKLTVIHLPKSVGKKRAIEESSKIAKGEIYAFMDSDCDMANNAVENAAKIMAYDPLIGAVTAQGSVRGARNGNIWLKLQQVYIDGSYRTIKGSESSFNSLTCCSGSLSFYRRDAVQDFIPKWAHDIFLGVDFKFCTDRRMTAHVLGTKPKFVTNNHKDNSNQDIGNDDYERMKTTVLPSQRITTDRLWKVVFSYSIRVNIGVPETFSSLIKQQIRWKKSFLRSLGKSGTVGIFWKRPLYLAMLYYIQTGMKFIRPCILFYAVIMLPLAGDIIAPLLWLSGIMFTGMIYGVDYRLRNPGDKFWLYRPLFTFLTTFVYTWLIIWSGITIRKQSWR